MSSDAYSNIVIGWQIDIEELLVDLNEISHMELRFDEKTGKAKAPARVIDRAAGRYLPLYNVSKKNVEKYNKKWHCYTEDGVVYISTNDWFRAQNLADHEVGVIFHPSYDICSTNCEESYTESWSVGFYIANESSISEVQKVHNKLIRLLPKIEKFLNKKFDKRQIKIFSEVTIA